MRLCISSYAFAWSMGVPGYPVRSPLTAEGLLDEAARLKADAVQLADNVSLERLSAAERAWLKEKADALRLGLEVGARGLTRENLFAFMGIAKELGSPILRFVIDRGDYEPPMSEVERLIRSSLGALVDHGLILAIENHDRFRVSEYVDLIENLGSERIGICLDTVNSLGAGQGYETVVNALVPYTVNLHVKDYIIRRVRHQMGFEVTGAPAGQGMLPLADLIRTLESYGRCQSAVLESWPAPEATIEATISKERDWAQLGAGNLREALNPSVVSQQNGI